MGTILSILPLFNTALSVIGAFKGDAQTAKVTGQIQDAVSVVTALTPLVQQWGNGNEVTPDDVRTALAGMHTALADFDALIAQSGD